MVDTIKFSQMAAGGDLAPEEKTPGLLSGANVLFNNPWTFLAPGSTADRPVPSSAINYRLRFNTDDQLYEYYDAVSSMWVQLQENDFTTGPYITYTADVSLPDAQNLGALADGILKQTITSDIATLNIAVNGTDFYGPGFVIPGTDGGTGVNNGALTIDLAAGANGYLLTSDSSGNATWLPPTYLTGAVLLSPTADQTITAHSLIVANGNLQATLGDVISGSSGNVGSFRVYPTTVNTGYLQLLASANSGNFVSTLTNASLGQGTSWILPDPGQTTAVIGLFPSTVTAGNSLVAGTISGTIVDGGSPGGPFVLLNPSAPQTITGFSLTVPNLIASGINGVPAVLSNNSAPVTYPGTASFFEVLGNYTNVLADTTQTINSVTPGGFNFVNGNRITLTYNGAGTNDLSRFYLGGQETQVLWTSANTAVQLVGTNSLTQYHGTDQGGRITGFLGGSAGGCSINTPSSGTATVTILNAIVGSSSITNTSNTNTTQNVTSITGFSAQSNVLNSAANNISNITNLHAFNSSILTLDGTGSGSSINITNLYGLRLQAPTITGTVAITNRFGISQEDAAASNFFAGPIATPRLSTAPAASQTSSLNLGTAFQNTLGYDVVLTVYLSVASATTASILLGVGPTITPTQQTIVNGLTTIALSIIPVTIYLPNNYYALLSASGTISVSTSGQMIMPV